MIARVRADRDLPLREHLQLRPTEQLLAGEPRVDLLPGVLREQGVDAREQGLRLGQRQGPEQLGRMGCRAVPVVLGAQLERPPPPRQLDASLLGQRERRAHDVCRDARTRVDERGGHEHRIREPTLRQQRVGELEHGPIRVVERQRRRVLGKRRAVSKQPPRRHRATRPRIASPRARGCARTSRCRCGSPGSPDRRCARRLHGS